MAVVAGERRIVTVLFADLVDSTAIGEQLGPERTKILLDEVMRVMSAEVERFEGTVAQYIGDELYALFGAPLAHEDDSERAVRSALAIQRALGRYAQEVEAAYAVSLAVRIAINTGPVVIRPESEDPYNAVGDTVNVASRIQKLVDGGEIVVGPSTKAQIQELFELAEMGEQDLRGVSEPIETFRVLGVREEPAERWRTPLVGRDFELSLLDRAMDGLAEGRGTIVAIAGEPGIGKSRLAAEVRARYADRVRFLEGRAVSYAAAFPYGPIRDLLHDWLGVSVSMPEARTRLELKAQLGRLFGEDADAAYPFLASLLGLTLEPEASDRIGELSRESLRHETFDFFDELVCRLADEQSLCLVFEDLHWADDASLELLESLLHVTEESAVGLVFLYRTEREHGSWRLGERARQRHPHRYRDVELRPLPDDASRVLAVNAAGAELPESVVELLTVRAGGNPFFLEAALHDLLERGILTRRNGNVDLAVDPDRLTVPTLVQGALQARLDRLEHDAREVISVAAVIGRVFALQLLEEVVAHDRLIPALSELQRLDLIVETRRRPSTEYSFQHGLVQEVAYSGLLEAKRRKLHARVGEALEALSPEPREDRFALLARHFGEADLPEKAVPYLLKAGDAARALYADQEALRHYEQAREFLGRLGEERLARDTLFKIALTHLLAFDFDRAEDAYDEAFSCRVPPSTRSRRTERIETGINLRSPELVPGGVYTSEALALLDHLFRGLLTVDRELNVLPAMADNLRVSDDGASYLFRIREEMRWSDGVPVTAEDFAYGWKQMREEGATTAFLLEDVESAEALDDLTLEVQLTEPRSYFPYILASAWSFPWPKHACEKLGPAWREPENLVCNGPFVLSEYTSEHALLTENPHWLGPHGNVREVRVTFGESSRALMEAWRGGEFDLIEAWDRSAADAEATLTTTVPKFGTYFVEYRVESEPFANELVRKAFSHALDRSGLIPGVALARPAGRGGIIPPAMPSHSPRLAPEYDLELARRLLADAGFPDGKGLPELELLVPSWLDPEPLVDQWSRLGARFRTVQATTHKLDSRHHGGDLWVSAWWADYPDPDGFLRGMFSLWPTLRADDELQELVAEARSLRDRATRMRAYNTIDRIVVSERAYLLPISYGRAMILRRPWVENVWANSMSSVHFDQVEVRR